MKFDTVKVKGVATNYKVFSNLTQYFVPRYDVKRYVKSKIWDNGTYVGINTIIPAAQLDVRGATFPVLHVQRDRVAGSGLIYGAVDFELTNTTPTAGNGIGVYMKAPNAAGTSKFAAMFGGGLSTITAGSEVGILQFGTSWQGADPSSNVNVTIKATSASTANTGFGVLAPTATVEIKAGTTTTAPLKLTAGSLLSSAQLGAVEFDGDKYYGSITGVIRKEFAWVENTIALKDSATNVKGYKTYYSSRVQDVTTNATYYPLFTSSTSGQYLANVSSTKLSFNPSTGNLTAIVLQLSDRRLKHDIQPLTPYDYKKLTDIKIVKAVFNDDPTNTHRFCVIAQDVEKSLPQFVYTDQNGQKAVYYIELMLAKIALLEKEIEILKKTKKDKWRAQ
ncbi:MAG: tail fiber domain-containing protein [Chlorobium sp.]|jgi:hypothetical protein|nr:tail fiber domain-containing protein [Chlorobium sp.]